jgi:hypothetical protein
VPVRLAADQHRELAVGLNVEGGDRRSRRRCGAEAEAAGCEIEDVDGAAAPPGEHRAGERDVAAFDSGAAEHQAPVPADQQGGLGWRVTVGRDCRDQRPGDREGSAGRG